MIVAIFLVMCHGAIITYIHVVQVHNKRLSVFACASKPSKHDFDIG